MVLCHASACRLSTELSRASSRIRTIRHKKSELTSLCAKRWRCDDLATTARDSSKSSSANSDRCHQIDRRQPRYRTGIASFWIDCTCYFLYSSVSHLNYHGDSSLKKNLPPLPRLPCLWLGKGERWSSMEPTRGWSLWEESCWLFQRRHKSTWACMSRGRIQSRMLWKYREIQSDGWNMRLNITDQ